MLPYYPKYDSKEESPEICLWCHAAEFHNFATSKGWVLRGYMCGGAIMKPEDYYFGAEYSHCGRISRDTALVAILAAGIDNGEKDYKEKIVDYLNSDNIPQEIRDIRDAKLDEFILPHLRYNER
jgi:hypothetical protein